MFFYQVRGELLQTKTQHEALSWTWLILISQLLVVQKFPGRPFSLLARCSTCCVKILAEKHGIDSIPFLFSHNILGWPSKRRNTVRLNSPPTRVVFRNESRWDEQIIAFSPVHVLLFSGRSNRGSWKLCINRVWFAKIFVIWLIEKGRLDLLSLLSYPRGPS